MGTKSCGLQLVDNFQDSDTAKMLSNSQPIIRILKRPPNLVSPEQSNSLNCTVKPPVIKSLQQREIEYAEARLRIFGPPDNEEKSQNNEKDANEVPKRIIKSTRNSGALRNTEGPDNTERFDKKDVIRRM